MIRRLVKAIKPIRRITVASHFSLHHSAVFRHLFGPVADRAQEHGPHQQSRQVHNSLLKVSNPEFTQATLHWPQVLRLCIAFLCLYMRTKFYARG